MEGVAITVQLYYYYQASKRILNFRQSNEAHLGLHEDKTFCFERNSTYQHGI
jgi:hypothetical protein